ncbi:MAG: DUF4873 domain-containing protein [Actinophytocola sp.]|nr:DUF4873 domain-containing protein [Actinophytocola sp.]
MATVGVPGVSEDYSGPAVLACGDTEIAVTVVLAGHWEPLDGAFHWYGRVNADARVRSLKESGRSEVTVTLPDGAPTPARLAEVDPWGHARVTGVGVPPFPLETLEDIEPSGA